MRVLGIAGSLRSGSLNRELLRLASESTPHGIELEIWEGLRDIPPFDADSEDDEPASVAEFRDAVRSADAVLISTPEYNHSVPGQLKNALDWASRPELMTCVFRNKPVAVVSASTGMFGGVWAQEDAKKILGAMGARVVDSGLAVGKADERLADPGDDLGAELRAVVEGLAAECAPTALVA
jgi:chromate reductase